MDQPRPDGRGTSALAWAVACVLLVGVVAAGVRVVGGDRPGRAVVSAVGGQSGTVDVTSTVTVTLPVPSSTPPTTMATTTTLPKAAVDVLNAIGSTTTTRRAPGTTTTRPPAPTTTEPAPPTVPTTTSTTVPAPYTATLVNEYPQAVVLIVNRRPFSLQPGQSLTEVLPITFPGDLVQVRLATDEKCGVSDSGVIFKPGASYDVTVQPGQTPCDEDTVRPQLKITPK
jgi:hypothetical protein